MSNRVLVSVQEDMENPSWLESIEPYMQKVLSALNFDGEEISVLFCNDAFIQELNKEYRNIDAPTDVLSFESGDEYTDEDGKVWLSMGDIIISVETVPKNAAYFGVSQNEELKRLLIHGTLHLNGYDHGEAHIEPGVEPDDEMLKLQETVLSGFSDITIIE
ncbi:MAG: rRNA maturation RNase YbeY [Treponema sp.]|nr:rRNA maturation RNase YbeY [Treponema sp.]